MNKEKFQQWCQEIITPQIQSITYARKPLIMGVLNVTPDSFSDGGRFVKLDHAYQHAQRLIAEGVDIIDVGGESSRPGASPLSCAEELERVIPIIARIREHSDICISIDTYKAEVMREAIKVGANIINDIKALSEPGALETAANLKVPVCLMHMQGLPTTMQENPHYEAGVIDEIQGFFEERIKACLAAGIARENIILDPGFAFGKSVAHNLSIMKRLAEFQKYHLPVLLGVSRKSTIGTILQKEVSERVIGGIAMALFAALQSVAIIRTHDVDETNQALKIIDAIMASV